MRLNLFKFLLFVLFSLTGILLSAGCGNQSEEKKEGKVASEILVSAAASLTDAFNELSSIYQKDHPDLKITYNFGSSGTLQNQIEEGANVDLFVSAGQKQMDALDKKDLIDNDTRRNFVANKVVLITNKDAPDNLHSFQDVINSSVKTTALGEPKGVPVGQYSEEVFRSLGIWDQVQPKATFGSDVRQVLDWVGQGEADCGVVYATDAAISPNVKIVAQAPDGSHKPVIYPMAIIKSGKNQTAARDFMNFLASDTAKQVLKKYGFQVDS